MMECDECGGRGFKLYFCPVCHGAGCWYCRHKGETTGVCDVCGGTGEIDDDEQKKEVFSW